MPQFEQDGVVLAYDDSGGSGSPPVVLLHGLGSARSTWDSFVPALAAKQRVLALDHRGHGDSAHATGTYVLDNYGADTVAFCEQVVGEPAVLVGHSLGGVIAAHLAAVRPDLVRGALLEDPPLFFGDPTEMGTSPFPALFGVLRQVLGELRGRGAPVEEYAALVKATPSFNGVGTLADVLGPEGTEAQARAMASLDPEVFTPAIEGMALAGAPATERLDCPVRVLRADPDLGPAFSAGHEKRFLAANPHATVEEYEGASHLLHGEMADRFLADVQAFLADVGSE
jgi:pimeloyl-ACP methyl ester carboxylesterase